MQRDPDHDPTGSPLQRRAIQLGLRGDVLSRYAREWIMGIEDISAFVTEQREQLEAGDDRQLLSPSEDVYPVADREVAARLGVSRC